MNQHSPSVGGLTQDASLKMVAAFAAIYLIWGTTYLAMAIAVQTIPPFMISGARFVFAGLLLLGFLVFRGVPLPSYRQWKWAAVIGTCLMVGGNGLVMWGIQEIPSGVCAVIIATMPLWMTVFDWLFYAGPRPTWRVATGLLLGLVGIVLLMGPKELMLGEAVLHLPSLLAVICAPIFWSLGSLHSRRVDLPKNVFMATGAEMICGGAVLLAISVVMQEPRQIDWAGVSWNSAFAVVYLTIFGSLIALTSYMWLLKNAVASRVATYTYVNPIIAVFLGWLVLDEVITGETLLATAVIVSAVVMIVSWKPVARPKA